MHGESRIRKRQCVQNFLRANVAIADAARLPFAEGREYAGRAVLREQSA
jgi:hypothetical protein